MRLIFCGRRIPGYRTSGGKLLLFALLFGLSLFQNRAQSQTAPGLHSVHSVFVAPAGSGPAAEATRRRLIDRLKKSSAVRVVNDAASADAILHSSAVIWPTGTVSPNPRSKSVVLTNYQGYLSAELTDASNRTLWSYLVTPSRFRMTNIVDDLADNLSARLLAALKAGLSTAATAPGATGSTTVSLRAAGATFPAPLYQKWFQSFAGEPNGFPINYDAIGSVDGLQQLAASKIDMAASDIPAQQDSTQSGLLYFPTIVGGVVPIYNLPGSGRPLNLTARLLADIYSGKIRKWNDSRIREANGGVRLPDAEIVVVHRSDGSGTTYAWTAFLAAASAEWKTKVGASVTWPVGEDASGNEGVADKVARTPNAIGYVELIYAIQHRLSYAAVQNPAGRFVKADLDSIIAAAASAHTPGASILNATDRNAYPIATFTSLVVPTTGENAERRTEIAKFLRWMLTTGQKQSSALGYAPLPREVVADELHAIDALK
jgi:phosphate ABC transporter phosphate-binding protein